MADEMDESLSAKSGDAVPKEKASEAARDSTGAGDEDGVASLKSASEPLSDTEEAAEAGEGVEVSAPIAHTEDAQEPVYERAQSVDQSRPPAASAGAVPKYAGTGRVEGGELDRPGLDLLYDVELDATLQFGSKEMLLRDVLELGPGDVVELDRHIAQPVDLVVGDRIVARGEVVVASGNFALRVTEVATPQMRLESIRCLF